MTGRIVPKYMVITAIIAMVVSGMMLAVFYGQYLLLSDELVETGATRFDESRMQDFETRSQEQMRQIAYSVGLHVDDLDAEAVVDQMMTTAIRGRQDLTGLIYVATNGREIRVGELDDVEADDVGPDGMLLDDSFVTVEVVRGSTNEVGRLIGRFSTESVTAATEEFRELLQDSERERQADSVNRIILAIVAAALFCALIIWLVVRAQAQRIRDLKLQAEKLSRSNFGEPLNADTDDEIGELARVFNEMRSELQKTTVSRDFVDKLLSGMNESVIVTDEEGVITRINDAALRMLDFEEAELVGTNIDSIVNSVRSGTLQTNNVSSLPDEAILLDSHGEPIPVSYTGSTIDPGDGLPGARIFAAQNITERRKAEKRIRYLARIDPLTKLPNRMQFQHLLQRSIARAKRSDKSLALFYIDVDHFKEINDTFGHMAGDMALETVASRLTEVLPDDCTVGRLAGDEFAVIIDKLERSEATVDSLSSLARKVLNRLSEPLYVQGQEVFIAASIGIACYPTDGDNVIDLIRNGDAALYHSKKNGGNSYTHYEPQLANSNVERLMTRSKLKRAFERNELLVRYQPRYDVETGTVVGAEALVRWQLPDRGIILPNDFIPLAEENDLIIQIGEWVLDRVCEDYRYWQRSLSSAGRVSVNLSLRQLRHSNFINRIGGILRSYEISPTCLELEITETTLMENAERTVRILDELYAQGLHLAIDDFGTGYSSLSALQQFPISTLKIDRSFVKDVATNQDDSTIVGTIIQMGNSLNMDVVAEGVETEIQLNYLQTLGCAYVQGMLFGQPMSSDEYLDLLLAQMEGTDKYRALFA